MNWQSGTRAVMSAGLAFLMVSWCRAMDTKPDVLFSGFLLGARHADLPDRFPYTARLIYETGRTRDGRTVLRKNDQGAYIPRDDGNPEFYRSFFDWHREHAPACENLRLITDKSDAAAMKTPLVAGLALSGEFVRTATVSYMRDDGAKVVTRQLVWVYLCLDYMVMDFSAGQLRSCEPILYKRVWVLTQEETPSDDDIADFVRHTWMDDEGKPDPELMKRLSESGAERLQNITTADFESLRTRLLPKLQKLTVRPKGFLAMQVADVTLDDKALAAFGEYGAKNPRALESLIAYSAADRLANTFDVCVTPYEKNVALGKMAFTMPDNTSQSLDIPPAYFAVTLDYSAFVALPKEEKRVETAYLLGAYLSAKVASADGKAVFYDKSDKLGRKMAVMNQLRTSWDFAGDHLKMAGEVAQKMFDDMQSDPAFVKGVIKPCQR